MGQKTVVLLVDDRRRDLMGNALIAHHLKRHGITGHLEPINAWQAVLGAHRPDMIVFNHLSVPHLAQYSRRLHEIGVLTAILPNEGIFYNPDDLNYSSRTENPEMHSDYVFCWNDVHRDALIRNKFCNDPAKVVTVGVPRFDFYCEPWKRDSARLKSISGRPVILMCGNFPLAHYHELPPEHADHFFAKWLEAVPLTRDYRNAIRANHVARTRFPRFVEALLQTNRYEIVVRPHPRESRDFYRRWMDGLPADQRQHLRLAMEDSIAGLILNCDLQVSCEHCTTALESWIVGQPTIELVFEKHPFWYFPERAGLNVECSQPEQLPAMVHDALSNPQPPALKAAQRAHLEKWCGASDGAAALRVADVIAEAVQKNKPVDWSKLNGADHRRALKLRVARALGQPYHYNPLLSVKAFFFPAKYAIKMRTYHKAIKPKEVTEARRRLEAIIANA